MAVDHSISGEYHWSRSDQTYFDITCPAYPLNINNNNSGSSNNNKGRASPSSIVKKPKKQQQQQSSSSKLRRPILQLSLYSKRNIDKLSSGKGGNKWGSTTKKDVSIIKDDDEFLGTCSINVLQILCGKTPYFDEWCTIHNTTNNKENSMTGRVRIVIEYDPTDPPPRYGDTCIFANVYPLHADLYPIAPYTIRNSTSITGRKLSTIIKRPKLYRVEEVVGDNVILSYQTPNEGWQCTFEVHRYLLLCVDRYQPSMEKYREQIMDLVDNVSQSPAVEEITKTIERLPEEGLVYVGTDIVEHTVDLLGRWWETGLDCMVEDIVNSTNLDGRYTQFISDDDDDDDDEEENEEKGGDGKVQIIPQSYQYEASSEGKKALPGMPCCPITGQPMIDPVVAADGHTYERYAIARWMETSKISPLTGEELFHNKLVPNYLLLSSLGNAEAKEEVDDDDDDDENLPGGTRPDAMNSIGQFDVL
jgi:hypothetical protein